MKYLLLILLLFTLACKKKETVQQTPPDPNTTPPVDKGYNYISMKIDGQYIEYGHMLDTCGKFLGTNWLRFTYKDTTNFYLDFQNFASIKSYPYSMDSSTKAYLEIVKYTSDPNAVSWYANTFRYVTVSGNIKATVITFDQANKHLVGYFYGHASTQLGNKVLSEGKFDLHYK